MPKYKIRKSEVLRYLGHRGQAVDEYMDSVIDKCIQEAEECAKPKTTYQIFDIQNRPGEGVAVVGTNILLTGNDIYEHLRECKRVALMAATLGADMDNRIRIRESVSMSESVILDSCATELIECVMDEMDKEIEAQAGDGFKITQRFSPGYGDLPLSIQPQFVAALDCMRKIGLSVTENYIMIPRKSVTAIVGIVSVPKFMQKPKSKCATCSMRNNCMFRKGGTTCERSRVYKG